MKKNLFLLFSFYFFVLQSVFLGLIRGEANFYWLGAINFVFISLIGLISKETKTELDDKNTLNKVEKLQKKETVEKITKIQKNKGHKSISHVWFFVISMLFGFFVWFWLGSIVLHLQLLIAVVGSFVLFILFGLLFKYKSLRMRESKVYMFGLIGLLIWSAIKMFNLDFSLFQNIQEDININMSDVNIDMDILTGSEVLFVSVDDENLTGDILDNTGIVDDVRLGDEATFGEVIKYLIDKNEIELNTKQNIKFTYVLYSSVDYPYYRTAYDQKMIGKTLNPDKNLLCETYIVMKGLAEERLVGSYTDIKLAYWDYAKINDDLPSCNYGEFVKLGDLK